MVQRHPEMEKELKRLMATNIAGLEEDFALDSLAKLVDLALDLRDPSATSLAMGWGGAIEAKVSDKGAPFLDYCMANAWANRYQELSQLKVWSWEQPEYQKQLFYLKRSIGRKEFESLDLVRRCQIMTNLANCLSTIGRFVEAQEYWNKALEIIPDFGVARGNRGSGATSYLRALYNPGHQAIFALFGYAELHAATQPSATYNDASASAARSHYQEKLFELGAAFTGLDAKGFKSKTQRDYSLGDTPEETEYRTWCLRNRLFLNPLNDVCGHSIGARDVLSTPSITCASKNIGPPAVIGFFNQMKQEYISARWQFYLGVNDPKPHFSDTDVFIPNTLDYASFGLPTEMVKSAFRSAYSIFDKIGYFMNQYFNLGVEDKKVSFRGIWYVPKKKEIRNDLEDLKNWPLRGLFWLSKDFFDETQDATDPDAKALYVIRNHLEHKFLRVHEFESGDFNVRNSQEGLGFSIAREEFERLTLHLLKLCRAALIYLSLAMENEERRRKPDGLVFSIPLPLMEDEWKY